MITPNDVLAEAERIGGTIVEVHGVRHIKFPGSNLVELDNFLLCVGTQLMKKPLLEAILTCSRKRRREVV